MSGVRHAAIGFGVVVMLAAGIFAFCKGIAEMNRSDAQAARDEQATFARANRICGKPPTSIITHGAGWSFGPWIEVRCQDGTVRSVKL